MKGVAYTLIILLVAFGVFAALNGIKPLIDDAGFDTTVALERNSKFAMLRIEVDATMMDVTRQTVTNNVIDSVLAAEGDLVQNKKPQVCADYQSQWTTIMVELDYK